MKNNAPNRTEWNLESILNSPVLKPASAEYKSTIKDGAYSELLSEGVR